MNWMVAWWFYSRIGGGLVKAAGKCGFLDGGLTNQRWRLDGYLMMINGDVTNYTLHQTNSLTQWLL